MIPKMLRFQLKIICHGKSQENLNLNEKRQSRDADTKVTHIFELSDKDFKAAIIKMLQQFSQQQNGEDRGENQ